MISSFARRPLCVAQLMGRAERFFFPYNQVTKFVGILRIGK